MFPRPRAGMGGNGPVVPPVGIDSALGVFAHGFVEDGGGGCEIGVREIHPAELPLGHGHQRADGGGAGIFHLRIGEAHVSDGDHLFVFTLPVMIECEGKRLL